jgi:hypothetical protein
MKLERIKNSNETPRSYHPILVSYGINFAYLMMIRVGVLREDRKRNRSLSTEKI